MKKSAFSVILAVLMIVALFTGTLTGCDPSHPVTPSDIVVTATETTVQLHESQVTNYDYTALFTVTKDGQAVTVQKSMLDLSQVSASADSFTVKCTYEGKTAQVTVTVTHTQYSVTLLSPSVTVNVSLAEDYDYNALFVVTKDGKAVTITDDMVNSNVVAAVGNYTYTVTLGNASATLQVVVTDAHEMLAVASYSTLSLTLEQLASYDVTNLFSLYVDGTAVPVTEDMIDVGQLQNAQEGGSYTVTFSYAEGASSCSAETTVNVVAEAVAQVTTRNVVTYPNGEYIDLTTLFEITKGDERVPVTSDMISGVINYSAEGENVITLTYDGRQYTATVEVVRGVIINYASASVVTVKKGTDKALYSFADDFVVMVNGIRLRNIGQYVDVSQVDFSQAGEYEAKLSVPYSNTQFGTSAPSFTYEEKTITYRVVETEYSLSVAQPVVEVYADAGSFNVFSNIVLSRNGMTNQVGDNLQWVNALYCYGRLVSPEVDLTKAGRQLVEVEVYVDCMFPDDELGSPVTVSYYVEVVTDVVITATDRVSFGNETIYTTDLFTITEGGEEIPVTYDMVSGKVDVFNAGVYEITAQYKGVTATATVVVLDPLLAGTYKTLQTTIPQEEEEDNDGYITEAVPGKVLGDMVIGSDGSITVNGRQARFVSAVSPQQIKVLIGNYGFTLYSQNGIAVLIPDNDVKMSYNEYMRPFIYFREDVWTVGRYVAVNYSDLHVLQLDYVTYSYDLFNVESKATGERSWYGLRTALVGKTSSDTVYEVTWGEATLPDGFVPAAGVEASLTMNGVTEKFLLSTDRKGKIQRQSEEKVWTNAVLHGTVDGKAATLQFDNNEGVTYKIGEQTVVSLGSYDYNGMNNGGVLHDDGILFVYSYTKSEGLYSYKFSIDFAARTFALLPQDGLFGLYERDNMFLFLDGYGTGEASFDTKSYVTHPFAYTVNGQTVTVTFINPSYDFAYGDSAQFTLADLKNVLTARRSHNNVLGSATFVNCVITDGAVISLNETVFAAGANCKTDILNAVSVVTKDGELTFEQKDAVAGRVGLTNIDVVDVSCVNVNYAGVYQLRVAIQVDGALKFSYYAVQVVTPDYADNPLVATYGTGAINDSYSFSLDAYGRAVISANGVTYGGYALYNGDQFVVRAFASDGSAVTAEGKRIASGIVTLQCSGAISFFDYFTTGTKTAAGCQGHVLRKISANGVDVYVYAVSATSLGEIVDVSADENDASVLIVTRQNGEQLAVRAEWGSASSGLTVADSVRGTYSDASGEGENLVLDGFGTATIGGQSGVYYVSGATVTVATSTNAYAYSLNVQAKTYVSLSIDYSTLVAGKTFTAQHTFSGAAYMYNATTSFTFNADGTVTAVSVCSEYEQDEGAYNPSYASQSGVTGTYELTSNKLIVKINSQTFAFYLTNVVQCESITCESTPLTSEDIGYFAVGTTFVKA